MVSGGDGECIFFEWEKGLFESLLVNVHLQVNVYDEWI